jgi:hypothetical protein
MAPHFFDIALVACSILSFFLLVFITVIFELMALVITEN